jgi:tetratricopeptide (TPR) repeat protein
MRKLILTGLLPAILLITPGCNEGDAPTTTTSPNEKTDAVASAPAANGTASDAPKSSAAAVDTDESTDPAAASAPDSVAASAVKTPDSPLDTVPATDLQEPEAEIKELGIGDAAPQIAISKWVKGDPVTSFDPEKVHVVEFWATWCGPCLASMPHIAALQTEYGDKVTFIGVSDEDEETVSGFMDSKARGSDKPWSEVLTYTIALDNERQTNAAYMHAAGQNGIPCAFIVGKTGNVEWIGHPAVIDEPLKQIVDGTWDSEKARVDFLAERELEKEKERITPQLQAAVQSGNFEKAVALLDEVSAKFPGNDQLLNTRLQFLIRGGMAEEANKAAAALIEKANDSAPQLNQYAWMLAMGNPDATLDLDLAQAAAERAVELSEEKDASILDTLARVLFKKGKIAEAIALQKKAVELAPQEPQIQAALEEYEAALKAAGENTEPAAPTDPPASDPPATDPPATDPPATDAPATDAPAADSPATDN